MIVDLDRARAQIGLYNADNDDRVMAALSAAHQTVLVYLKSDALTRWFEDSIGVHDVPPDIGHAILMVCENLFNDSTADPFTPAVVSLLAMYRDPAVA